ncbi:hypothetical protein D6Z18_25815 [Escherichia coli]|nr:hypothetical protein [Escherichia coli]
MSKQLINHPDFRALPQSVCVSSQRYCNCLRIIKGDCTMQMQHLMVGYPKYYQTADYALRL